MEATITSAPGPHDRPRPDGTDVRLMTEADVPAASQALADAFYDDPMMSWVTPDGGVRRARLERAFAFYLEDVWLKHELCYVHSGGAGASLWEPPNTWKLGVIAQLRLMPRMIAVTRGDIFRMMRFLTTIEKHHPQEEHYYRAVVGVVTAWQGRGFGSALMRPVLDRCDAERMPAYLEATSARSRALYERHGFVARDPLTAGDSPPFWPMWREPGAG